MSKKVFDAVFLQPTIKSIKSRLIHKKKLIPIRSAVCYICGFEKELVAIACVQNKVNHKIEELYICERCCQLLDEA